MISANSSDERHALIRSLLDVGEGEAGGQEPAARPAPVRYRRLR
jgi:hypothetical protein